MEAVNAIGVQHTAALIEAAEPRWSNEKSAASATSLHVRLRNRYEICFFILFPTTASLTQGVWTLFWAIRPNTLHFCTGMHHHADWMQLKRAFSKGPSFPVDQLLYHCVRSTLSDQNEIFRPWFWNSYCTVFQLRFLSHQEKAMLMLDDHDEAYEMLEKLSKRWRLEEYGILAWFIMKSPSHTRLSVHVVGARMQDVMTWYEDKTEQRSLFRKDRNILEWLKVKWCLCS